MPKVRISLTVTFDSPPSVGAGGASGTLADKVVTRNARNQFIIPASQVKGKLRHACEQIARSQGAKVCDPPQPERMCPNADGVSSPCLLCRIFGSPGHRSRLRFHDLVAAQEDLPEETLRPMVSLNRRRRTAEEKRLFLVETAPYIGNLEFRSEEAVTGLLETEAQLHLLLAGLRMVFAWGGATSHGLGWGKVCWKAWLDDRQVESIRAEEVRELCQS